MAISPAPVPSRVRGMRGLGRPAMVLVGIWALGLVGLGAVYVFANRVDETRRAQIVIADIRIQQETLLSIAASPALSGGAVTPEQAALQVAQAKLRYNRSVAALSRFGRSDAPARIRVASDRHFRFVDQIGALVARGRSIEAIRELGKSHQPAAQRLG